MNPLHGVITDGVLADLQARNRHRAWITIKAMGAAYACHPSRSPRKMGDQACLVINHEVRNWGLVPPKVSALFLQTWGRTSEEHARSNPYVAGLREFIRGED